MKTKKVLPALLCATSLCVFVAAFAACGETAEAKTYTVTFVSGGETVETVTAEEGKTIESASVTIAEGVRLDGWYVSETAGTPFDFETTAITGDITLYARYSSLLYTVTYKLDGGDGTAPVQDGVNADGTFTVTEAQPIRTGYLFKGWTDGTKTYSAGDIYQVDDAISVVLTAQWEATLVNIVVINDSGETLLDLDLPYGSDVPLEEKLYKHTYECYRFIGLDGETTNITENTVFTAQYEYVPTDLSYFEFREVTEGGKVIGYNIGMAEDKDSPWYDEESEWNIRISYTEEKMLALPDEYNGLPVIGFIGNFYPWSYEYDYTSEKVIYIPDSYLSLGMSAFDGLDAACVIMGKGLQSIDVHAFNQTSIDNWIISPENEYFSADGDILYNKDKTELIVVSRNHTGALVIPKTVNVIYPNACFNSENITSVVIEGDVEEIGAGAFAKCVKLESFVVKGSVKRLADAENCADPDYSFDYFSDGVFADVFLSELILPGIEYIGFGTFTWTGIETLVLDNTLQHIDLEAFVTCYSLSEIRFINGTVSNNGKFIIENNTIVEKGSSDILLEDGVTYGDTFYLYAAAQEGTSFVVPETVRSFGNYAFQYSENLQYVTIPEGVEVLTEGLFMGSGLVSVTIPASVRELSIGDESSGSASTDISPVFYGCPLEEVFFAEGSQLTEIPLYTFFGNQLTSFEIPAKIVSIGEAALTSQTITEFTVSEGNEYFTAVDGVLYNKDVTELVLFPSGKTGTWVAPETLEVISTQACLYSLISSVTLNEGLKEIRMLAFYGSAMEELTLPSTLEVLDWSAFDNCTQLKTITINFAKAPDMTDNNMMSIFGSPLFEVDDTDALTIVVPEENYSEVALWLDTYSDYVYFINTSAYSDAATFLLDDGNGEEEVVTGYVLMSYSVPEREGYYFQGFYTKDGSISGDWGEELKLPYIADRNATVTFYAKWGTEVRRDGTSDLFAYLLPVGEEISVTVTEDAAIVYFETPLTQVPEEDETVVLLLYINGEVVGYLVLSYEEIPEDGNCISTFDFAELVNYGILEGFPAEVTVMIELEIW